jgi:hypothetical protein
VYNFIPSPKVPVHILHLGNIVSHVLEDLRKTKAPNNYVFCIHVWCDVNFSLVPCLFVLWRVEEPVAEDSGVQQVEVAEQELIEGKLYP